MRGRSARAATCPARGIARPARSRARRDARPRRRCRGRARSARSRSGTPTRPPRRGCSPRGWPGFERPSFPSPGRPCRPRCRRRARSRRTARRPSGRSAPKIASVLPPSPAAGTRSGMSCASAPFIASNMRKPVTPRIDDAPGITTCVDRARLRDHVDRPERARRVRDLERQRAAHDLVDAGLDERPRAVERPAHHRRRVPEVGDDLVAAIVTVAVIGTSQTLDPVRVEVVGERRGAVGPGGDLLPHEPLGVVDQLRHQLREPPPRPWRVASSCSARSAMEHAATCALRSPRSCAGCARSPGSARTPPRPARPPRRAGATAAAGPPGRPRCCRTRSSPAAARRRRRGARSSPRSRSERSSWRTGLTTKMSGGGCRRRTGRSR